MRLQLISILLILRDVYISIFGREFEIVRVVLFHTQDVILMVDGSICLTLYSPELFSLSLSLYFCRKSGEDWTKVEEIKKNSYQITWFAIGKFFDPNDCMQDENEYCKQHLRMSHYEFYSFVIRELFTSFFPSDDFYRLWYIGIVNFLTTSNYLWCLVGRLAWRKSW